MTSIQTELVINADALTVWSVLMNFEEYPNWIPFIRSISGEKKPGKKLTVFLQPPGGNGMTFKPVVLKLDPNKEFRWKGTLGIKAIFDGEHFFILEALKNSQTRFIHGENFSGMLLPLMGKLFDKTKAGFELMNESIKRESEKYAVP
jgi:hypothetical protein